MLAPLMKTTMMSNERWSAPAVDNSFRMANFDMALFEKESNWSLIRIATTIDNKIGFIYLNRGILALIHSLLPLLATHDAFAVVAFQGNQFRTSLVDLVAWNTEIRSLNRSRIGQVYRNYLHIHRMREMTAAGRRIHQWWRTMSRCGDDGIRCVVRRTHVWW